MADIDNPQAVRFCNERVRTAANAFAQLYNWAKSVSAEWTAQDMALKIANSAGDKVIDGSATDGRPIITGEDVYNVKDLVSEIIMLLETNTSEKLNKVLRVAPHPTRGIMD